MNPVNVLKTTAKIGAITLGALYTVYQFNLDMRLIGWVYLRVNEFHARKVRDIQF
jgi:hypothetical protein